MHTAKRTVYTNDRVVVIHFARTGIDRNVAKARFDKLIDFLHTASVSDIQQSPSVEIDEMWHDFLLCSRDYRDFCMEHLGAFIDHEPLTMDKETAAICYPSKETAAICYPSIKG